MTEPTTITVPRPHVPHGPQGVTHREADADYLMSAARNLESQGRGARFFGSNLTATVVKLLRDAAGALGGAATAVQAGALDGQDQAALDAIRQRSSARAGWAAVTQTYSSALGDYQSSHIPGVVDEPMSGYDVEATGAMDPKDAELIIGARDDIAFLLALVDRLSGHPLATVAVVAGENATATDTVNEVGSGADEHLDDAGELDTVAAYAVYQWDCECGDVNEVDHDPCGETVECDSCDGSYVVSETR